MKFECRKCRYKMDKAELPQRCPYCGASGTMRKASSAQDILNEVTDETEELQSK